VRNLIKTEGSVLLFACWLATASASAIGATFVDPLLVPAVVSDRVARSMLVAVTQKPDGGWVAVGRHGNIVLSRDGKSWRQAGVVPVSTDLVSVFFIDANMGWAVGHGGVIISTTDGGQHWTKQFDGRQAADALVKYYEPLTSGGGNQEAASGLADAIRFRESGPGRPFLDIWFADKTHGYAIGAYNLIFTTVDGGNSWQPRPDMLSNEEGLHLNAITRIGDDIVIAGERGLFARLNRDSEKFSRIGTPYAGTFFGVTGKEGLIVLFGLQGNAFRSMDNGKQWQKIETGLKNTITSGAMLANGNLVLASQAGVLAISKDNGDHFSHVSPTRLTPIYAIAPGSDRMIVAVGNGGVTTATLE
jgi:photosystem II stability/assembly factor-like uncharacterized protein